jgi:hypothetical protein
VICLPALALPSIAASPAMTPTDKATAMLLSVAIGAVPLAVGLLFAAGLRVVRVYEARARLAAGIRSTKDPLI